MHPPFDALGQAKCPQGGESANMFQHVPGVRRRRRLAQLGQGRDLAGWPEFQQAVQRFAVIGKPQFGESAVNAPLATCDGLSANPLNDIERGQQD
jgi:hypothetical protein